MRLLAILIFVSSFAQGQGILFGVVGSSRNYGGAPSEGRVYTAIPTPPTFSNTVTLIQGSTGVAIQSGDIAGKTDWLIGSDYTQFQVNNLNGNYRICSQDATDPSTWAQIGAPGGLDYSLSFAVQTPGVEYYNLYLHSTDNMIKASASVGGVKDQKYQNLILMNPAFAGFLINEKVTGEDYGNITLYFCRVSGAGGENFYCTNTDGDSGTYGRGITSVKHFFGTNSGREGLQFNGHENVQAEYITCINGGLDETTNIGQQNCIQVQNVFEGYCKKAIFWNFEAPGMVATDQFLFEDCFFGWRDPNRTIYLQSLIPNNYIEFPNTGGTVTYRRCTFYNPDFINDVMFTMQGSTRNYVFEDCIFPLSVQDAGIADTNVNEIADDQRADKVTYSVTIINPTFTNTPPLPSFVDPPESAYVGYEKVIGDDHYYNRHMGYRSEY